MLGAVALWWFKFAGDELRARVEETAAPVIGGLASAWRWLVDAILRLKDRAMGEQPLVLLLSDTDAHKSHPM